MALERGAPVSRSGGGGEHGDIVAAARDHFRVRWNAELGISHDAHQRAAARQPGAVGKPAVIGQNSSHTSENGVGMMPKLLHVRARRFASDPPLVILGSGDLAIQGQGGFESHEWPPCSHEVNESLVQFPGLLSELTGDFYLYSGCAQLAKALAGNQRIWILHGRNHAPHARSNERVDAGPGTSFVSTRLQIDVEHCIASLRTRLLKRMNFCVLKILVPVKSAAYHV